MAQLIVNVGAAAKSRTSESVRDGFMKVNTNFGELYTNVASLSASIAGKANLASPNFTGTPTAPTAAVGNNSTQLANTAFCVALFNSFVGAASGTLVFQTSWDASSGSFPATSATGGAVKKGHIWKVSVTGSVDGQLFTAGDELYAIVDNPSTAVYANNWLKIEGSISLAEVQAAVGFTFGSLAALSTVTASLISDASANGRSLIQAANYAAMRGLLSLGSAATLDAGTSVGNLVQVQAGGALPALSAANLTNLPASGKLVSRAYAEYSALTKITALIPYDDTIPQDTEGVEIMSVTITPASATNRFRARFRGTVSSDATYPHCIVAIFASNDANAKVTSKIVNRYTDWGGPSDLTAEVEWVTGTTSAVTISVRAGAYYSGGFWFNSLVGGYREYGASQKSTFVVEEITP